MDRRARRGVTRKLGSGAVEIEISIGPNRAREQRERRRRRSVGSRISREVRIAAS